MRIKKVWFFVIFFLSFIIFLSASVNSFGAASNGELELKNIKSIRYASSGGIETVTINIDRYEGVHSFYLAEPGRFVIDITGAVLPSGIRTLDVGTGSVYRVRYSMFDTRTARIVVDLSKAANFTVKTGKGFIKAEAVTGANDTPPVIGIPSEQAPPAGAPAVNPGNTPQTHSDGSGAQTQPSENGILDINQTDSGDSGALSAAARTPRPAGAPRPTATPKAQGTPRPTRTPRITRPTQTPSQARNATPRIPRTDTPETTPGSVVIPPPVVTKDEFRLEITPSLRVVFSTKGGINACTIEASGDVIGNSAISLGKDPPGIIVEIPYAARGAAFVPKTMTVNADVLRRVTVSQPGPDLIRVVFEIRDRVGVETVKDAGMLKFILTNEFIANAGYYKNGERAFITLYQTALTSGGETLSEFYDISSKDGGAIWNITFDNERGPVGTGGVNINDDLLKSVEINKRGQKTTLSISAKVKVRLVICTKQSDDHNYLETTVSIVRPAAGNERVVVIDAGHGGYDPGAVGLSGRLEKDFNLDIALKLKERLSQDNRLRVFLTRDGDYFVDLYERARLANELKATLFVSIHANASGTNPDAAGIETLYCPTVAVAGSNAFTSRQFAEITQRRLTASLRNVDRGIVERPNLVVLRRTDMPAILVETAFLTNAGDLLNLSRSAYRKNIAYAVADSINEALILLSRGG